MYGRKCRTPICWEEVGERKLLGPEIVQLTTDKVRVIKKRMKEAQDRQKSYADLSFPTTLISLESEFYNSRYSSKSEERSDSNSSKMRQ
jgi:hypothetical protein